MLLQRQCPWTEVTLEVVVMELVHIRDYKRPKMDDYYDDYNKTLAQNAVEDASRKLHETYII